MVAARPRWILFFCLALLIHFLLLEWMQSIHFTTQSQAPIRIETLSPKHLSQIQNQWKKSLLINPNPTLPHDQVTPDPMARYETDRVVRVEKESRAERAQTLPQAGATQNQALQKFSIPWNLGSIGSFEKNQNKIDQALDDLLLGWGAENLLNTTEGPFYAYQSRIYQTLAANWLHRLTGTKVPEKTPTGDYKTVVEVVLDRDGNLKELQILKGSGIQILDSIVENTWTSLARFPNPPTAMLDAQKEVHMTWSFLVELNPKNGISFRF